MARSHTTPSLDEHLENIAAAVFQSGLSSAVVEAKWDGFDLAFSGFDPAFVANLTPEDVDRLVKNPDIIRNRRKIEALIDNAVRLLELDDGPGGFDVWLASHGSLEATVAAVRREFRFLGPQGARLFLRLVDGEDCR